MEPTRGNNQLSAKYSYVQREMYEEEVNKLLKENPQISLIDLRSKVLYGKVDLDSKIIVPRAETLIAFEGAVSVLPFVAAALEDLSAAIARRKEMGTMRRTGPYATLQITPRQSSWKEEYVEYLKSLKNAYLSRLRENPVETNKLSNFKDFVLDFLDFTSIANPRFPTSFSKFYVSGWCSPFTSGCTVDLNSEEYGNDHVSTAKYFSDVNFKIFAQEAQNHGS